MSRSRSGSKEEQKRSSGSKPPSPQLQPQPSSVSGSNAGSKRNSGETINPVRPTSASKPLVNRVPSGTSSTNGPVKGLYRPGAAAPTASAAAAPAPSSSSSSSHVPTRPTVAPPASSRPPKPYKRKPKPEDSDYDSDEVVSEEESEEEKAMVYPAAQPLSFKLTTPQWNALEGDEIAEPHAPEYPSDTRLSLQRQHFTPAGEQIYPVTRVESQHQSLPIVAGAEKTVKQAQIAGSERPYNVMSYSSTDQPEQSNDLLYTDAHAPYTYHRHARPLTIWLLGKPLSGKKTLARRLAKELSHTGWSTMSSVENTDGNGVPHLTPEFLLAHAKDSSSTPGQPKYPEIDQLLLSIGEGRSLAPSDLLKLFIFALHSDRIQHHGYILSELPFPASELSQLLQSFPALAEKGVWPPQYVFDVEISNEEILDRLSRKKQEVLNKRLGDAMGFREPKDSGASVVEEELDEQGNPLSTTGTLSATTGLSRPTSASRQNGGGAGGDGEAENGPEEAYNGFTSLHRTNELLDYDEDEFPSFGLGPGELPTNEQVNSLIVLPHTSLVLDSEVSLQMDLLSYEATRVELVSLLKGWNQFYADQHASTTALATLNAAQHFLRVNGLHSVSTMLDLVLHALGQNRWTRVAQAQHLLFMAKEELKPIEEDEVREILVLTNLNNSNAKERDGAAYSVASIPLPLTTDPTGLDFESEALIESSTVQHEFSIFQTFCPVSYYLDQRLVEGSEEFTVSYMGQIYLMSTVQYMKLFQEAPTKYCGIQNAPPSLPRNFTLAIIGGQSVGKSSLSELFVKKYGWELISCEQNEESISKAHATITAKQNANPSGNNRFVLDNAPSTIPLLEYATSIGFKFDKVLYLFVEDVEQIPPRLRLAKKAAKAAAAAAAAVIDPATGLPVGSEKKEEEKGPATPTASTTKKKKKGAGKGDKKKAGAGSSGAAGSENAEEETTPEEEDLMDRVEDFQNEWGNTLLPFLEEHMYSITEVNNSNVPVPAPQGNGGATATPMIPSSPIAGTHSISAVSSPSNAAAAAAATALPATIIPSAADALEIVFESARALVDPFYLYRHHHRARRLTAEELEAASKDDDKFPRGPENRGLKYGETNYCLVCLLKDSLLIPGNANEAVAVGNSTYSLCSASCVDEFLANSQKYNLNSPQALEALQPTLPALRILLTGPRASGKSHTAALLKQKYGLHHSFALSSFFYPALRSLTQKTLDLVLETERAAAEKKAAREAKKAAKQAEKDARRAAAEANGEELPSSDDEDSAPEDGEESDESDPEAEEAEAAALEEKKDLLQDFMSTSPAKLLEFHEALTLLLEAELFTSQQLEQILREIFVRHTWVNATAPHSANNVAGWVCEVDLHNALLLARLEAVLKEGEDGSFESRVCKPHVILPLDSSARVAINRLVTREMARRAHEASHPEEDAAFAAGGKDSLAEQERKRKREAHRAKLEAERLQREKEAREKEEAAAAAKAAKEAAKKNRFGKKTTLKEKKEQELKEKEEKKAAEEAAAKSKKKKKGAAEEDAAEEGDESASPRNAEDANADADASAASAAAAAAAAAALASGEPKEKTADELAAEEALEKLMAQAGELHKLSTEIYEGFLSAFKQQQPGGYVILEPVSGSAFVKSASNFLRVLIKTLQPFLQAQNQFFLSPIEISMNDAFKLLRNGLKSLRQYGSYCPCCLSPADPHEASAAFDCMIMMNLARNKRGGSATTHAQPNPTFFPIVWNHNVIMTCSAAHRAELVGNVKRYLSVAPPAPLTSQSIVVLENAAGDSKALAAKLSEELNLVHLTISSVLERVSTRSCKLGKKISALLRRGQVVPNALLVQALNYVVSDRAALTQGWVLDGFPSNRHQARLMKRAGIVPNEVISLWSTALTSPTPASPAPGKKGTLSSDIKLQSEQRSAILEALALTPDETHLPDGTEVPPPDSLAPPRKRGPSSLLPKGVSLDALVVEPSSSAAVLLSHAEDVLNYQKDLVDFYTANYNNCTELYVGAGPASANLSHVELRSLWQQSERVLQLIRDHKRAREEYRVAIQATRFDQSKPARIAALGFTRAQLIDHASAFQDFCPLCWIHDGVLNRSIDVAANVYTVEYKQQFYRTCSEAHREAFIASPEKYMVHASPRNPLPSVLPFALLASDASRVEAHHCELNGYCPVTISQSQAQGAVRVVPGSNDHMASYQKKVYRLAGERELRAFLGRPAFFSRVELPQKMPVSIPTFTSEQLLKLGKTLAFMEKEFSALLMKGLNSFEELNNTSNASAPAAGGGAAAVRKLRIKYPALPLNSSALLYLALFLKKHNPRNPTWLTEKYDNKLKEFVSHCHLIPQVAGYYRVDESNSPQAAEDGSNKPAEEEKQASPATNGAAASALYDELRSELQAHSAGIGSRKSLAQFFERYLR